MNKGLWIARKNYLYCLVKKVSDGYGGDDEEFFKRNFAELVDSYPGELIEYAIACYAEMVNEIKYFKGT